MSFPDGFESFDHEIKNCDWWVFWEFLSLWAMDYGNSKVDIWVIKEYTDYGNSKVDIWVIKDTKCIHDGLRSLFLEQMEKLDSWSIMMK